MAVVTDPRYALTDEEEALLDDTFREGYALSFFDSVLHTTACPDECDVEDLATPCPHGYFSVAERANLLDVL